MVLALFAAVCACIFFYAGAGDARFDREAEAAGTLDGDGSEQNPYLIADAEDLAIMSDLVNNNDDAIYRVAYYSVTAPIDLDDLVGTEYKFAPIGTVSKPFTGNFSGNGNLIYNLNITENSPTAPLQADQYIGLFGYVGNGGSVSNVGVTGAAYGNNTALIIGGIAGYNAGTVYQCFFEGTLTGSDTIGGIVGHNTGTVRSCFANGSLYAGVNNAKTGGLIGVNGSTGSVSYSYDQCEINVSVQNAYNVGGIIGNQLATTAHSYCYYNSSLNPTLKALGASSAGASAPADTDTFRGMTSQEMDSAALTEIFGLETANSWVRKYRLDDHTGYTGLLLKVFDVAGCDDNALSAAVTVRMFGIDRASSAVWGSEDNPYLVTDAEQLDNLAVAVNDYSESFTGDYFLLTADVTPTSNFKGIGVYANNATLNRPFSGTFDGGNHTVRGLNVSSAASDNYLGLFGYTSGALICNLTLAENCLVSGGYYVGSLVGYSANTVVKNVASFATVESAYGNSGGIVGYDERGSYDSVLSAVTFSAPDNVSSVYGFIGNGRTVLSVNNVWYLAEDVKGGKVNRFLTSNNLGAVLRVDTAYGNVVASKDAEGNITFSATASDGWSTEYRLATESVVFAGDAFTAPQSAQYNANTVHARFVKEITASVTGVATASFRETGAVTGKYYVGQQYRLAVTVRDGYYLRSISGAGNGSYVYEPQSLSVVYTDTMRENTSVLGITTDEIAYDELYFPASRVYDAQPVEFDKSKLLNMPADFRADVIYSGGSAPVNASADGVPYTLTIIYYNASNVRVGSKSVAFTVTRAALSLTDVSGLPYSKQWDNSDTAEGVSVDVGIVSGLYAGDEVTVTANMRFGSSDITGETKTDITYTFAISGRSASNYTAPSPVTRNGVGEITKRDVYFKPLSLTGIYNALYPSFGSWDVIDEIKNVKVNPTFKFVKVVEDGSEGYTEDTSSYAVGDVGLYKVTIADVSDSEHYVPHLYNAKIDESGNEYVIYTVVPREVSVSYTVAGQPAASAELVYNGSAFNIGAQFTDALGKSVSLNSYLNIYLEGSSVSEAKNAGAYIVGVENFDNDNYILTNPSQEFKVSKADQAEITVTVSVGGETTISAEFTDEITFGVTGGTLVGSETVFELVAGEEVTGDGTIADSVLIPSKAGVFRVKATLKGNDNYNDVSAETVFTVNKSELKIAFGGEAKFDYLDGIIFPIVYDGLRNDESEPAGLTGIAIYLNGEVFDPQKAYDADVYELTLDVSGATAYGYTLALGENAVSALTVNKRAVTVRAANATSVYGEPDAVIEFEVINDDKVTADMIAGALSRKSGTAAGIYAVTLGNIVELNPNFDVSLYEGEGAGIYEITAAQLTVRITAQTKYYGEPDPVVKYVVEGLAYDDSEESIGLIDVASVIDRVQGEAAAIGDVVGVGYDYTVRQGAAITHTSANYAKTVIFAKAALTILPAAPTPAEIPSAQLDAKCSLSAVSAPQVAFMGAKGEELTGGYVWKDGATVPDFTDSATVECMAVFTPDDLNYAATEYPVNVNVIPKQVTVTFSGSSTVTYTGSQQPDVEFTVDGADEGDDLGVSVTYSGDRTNAGTFKATVTVSNMNYAVSGSATRTVKIEKAVLNVALTESEITVNEGDTVDYVIYYFGFVGSDDESVLESAATVTFPTEPGVYNVSPKGVSADNYTVKYGVTVFRVNKGMLYSETSDVILEGSFPASLEVSVVAKENDEDGIDSEFNSLKAAYNALGDKTLSEVFRIEYLNDGEAYEYTDKISISMMLDEKYEDTTKLAFAVKTYNGDILYISDVTYKDGRAVFDVENAEYVIVAYATGEESNILLYAGIGAGAAVVLIVLIAVVVKLKRKRAARFIKYRDDI